MIVCGRKCLSTSLGSRFIHRSQTLRNHQHYQIRELQLHDIGRITDVQQLPANAFPRNHLESPEVTLVSLSAIQRSFFDTTRCIYDLANIFHQNNERQPHSDRPQDPVSGPVANGAHLFLPDSLIRPHFESCVSCVVDFKRKLLLITGDIASKGRFEAMEKCTPDTSRRDSVHLFQDTPHSPVRHRTRSLHPFSSSLSRGASLGGYLSGN
jgi:hypothetical protein